MWNTRLDESQAGIKIAGRSIINLRYTDDTTLMVEREEELKSLLMRGKEESKKAGLKLNFQNTYIMASGLVTWWQIDGEKVEAVTNFIFLGSKITLGGNCRHEIKMLAPWKESYDKPRHLIKQQRHHFANKGMYSKAMVFPVVMNGCESWTIKKAEYQRINAFELWCWRRLKSP